MFIVVSVYIDSLKLIDKCDCLIFTLFFYQEGELTQELTVTEERRNSQRKERSTLARGKEAQDTFRFFSHQAR